MQQQPDQITRQHLTVMAFFFAIAAVGATLRGLHRKMTLREVALGAGTSGLVGGIVGLILLELWGPEAYPYILGAVSILSWIGGTVVLDAAAAATTSAATSRWQVLLQVILGRRLPPEVFPTPTEPPADANDAPPAA